MSNGAEMVIAWCEEWWITQRGPNDFWRSWSMNPKLTTILFRVSG